MNTDMAPCLHIITVTYLRYQNRPIQNRYHINTLHFMISICIQTAWSVETLNNMYMWRHYMNHTSIWSVNLHGVWRHTTLHNIHINTNMNMNMEHESTWSVNIHGVWRHSTLRNIHMDANIDMDTECESTCSVFWVNNCSSSQWDQFQLKIWCVQVSFNICIKWKPSHWLKLKIYLNSTHTEKYCGYYFVLAICFKQYETNLNLRSGVFRCQSTSVLNHNLHINSNQKYIWILHTQRKIVVTIFYQLSVLNNKKIWI